MLKDQAIFLLLYLLVLPTQGSAQEITIFKVSDFDLNGHVKTCLVSTDYGKEKYTFNEDGFLIEAVTRFSDTDYDVTLYKYQNDELMERRVEHYRDELMDRATSIANIYTIDTVGNRKVTEKVVTYENEVLEQNEYLYKANGRLSKLIRTNNEGIDETSVSYHQEEDTDSAHYTLNNESQKTIKTSIKKTSDTTQIKTVATKKFLEGEPNSQKEEVFNTDGKLLSETRSNYDNDSAKFMVMESFQNTYGPNGILEKTEMRKGKGVKIQEYIYQFDTSGNWIKEIITPGNTYKTRKITYYETDIKEQSPE